MLRTRYIALVLVLFCATLPALAKEIRVAVFKVEQMSCGNCEKKIVNNMKFEKGLKKIETDLKEKTVTITYDAEKTNVDDLKAGFKKIKYEVELVSDTVQTKEKDKAKAKDKDKDKTKDKK